VVVRGAVYRVDLDNQNPLVKAVEHGVRAMLGL
jgi:hypothetical protein